MNNTLAIDFGSKYIGLALVQHGPDCPNRVLYAATLIAEAKRLKAIVETRAGTRRIRRTRKTHARRLRRLRESLAGIPGTDDLLRFCRRRGFSYESDELDDESFRVPRAEFFAALEQEIDRLIPAGDRARVLAACVRHLNRDKRASSELRPARFENRGRARCNWEGCPHNVPRAEHDLVGRLQQSLFLWLQPIFAASADPAKLRRSVDHWIGELVGLSHALVKIKRDEGEDTDAAKAARKPVAARIKRVYQNLRQRVQREAPTEAADQFLANWDEYYRAIVSESVRGQATGRVRFCRQHSSLFVDHVLANRPPPIKQEVMARDLVSRTQQIVFDRLARLIEARVLPLAGGTIDRLVVERVAFDILSGPIKARQSMSEEAASEIYWHGPQAGFESRAQMLHAEFDGRCAYCGQQARLLEDEHILHRGRFPFDSYFNLVPACAGCNARKAGRTALEAGLLVNPDAYQAFCGYLQSRRVLHPYHTIKKGILNLLTRPATANRGQQMIALIADNLVAIAGTQRSPRPLARYLATRLARTSGVRPKIEHRAGRHTALYRGVALPDYDKAAEKEGGDVRNHAVDAIMLACDFPSAAALENRQWTTTQEQVEKWQEKVRAAAPAAADGVPVVEPVALLPFFEDDLGSGYCRIDLSAFNWNRRRKAAHKLDPFGKTQDGRPIKRIPAANVLEKLRGAETVRDKQISQIAHRGLRARLERNRSDAAAELIRWLQASIRTGAGLARLGTHPADIARRRLLESFAVADVLSPESPASIPWIVGVKVLSGDTGARQKVHVVRSLPGNSQAQHYQAESVVKQLLVGYCQGDEGPDRTRPVLLAVNQIDAVKRQARGKWTSLDVPADSPLLGRPLGSAEPLREFRRRWQAALDELLRAEGIAKLYRLSQGCVIEKTTGERFQLRNFDKSEPWMNSATFKNIHHIHRSPLAAMRSSANSPSLTR
jgi:hypothetical protein